MLFTKGILLQENISNWELPSFIVDLEIRSDSLRKTRENKNRKNRIGILSNPKGEVETDFFSQRKASQGGARRSSHVVLRSPKTEKGT
jgi:hypothetical protein